MRKARCARIAWAPAAVLAAALACFAPSGEARADQQRDPELKALLLNPTVEQSLDPQSLACFLALGYVPTPRTIFTSPIASTSKTAVASG